MDNYSFPRTEHLKSTSTINALFQSGKSSMAFPLKISYIISDVPSENAAPHNLRVAFTVPKRRFRKAVDRNRIKRQMIECFRLHRAELIEKLISENKHIDFMIIYVGNEFPVYSKLKSRMVKALNKLCQDI